VTPHALPLTNSSLRVQALLLAVCGLVAGEATPPIPATPPPAGDANAQALLDEYAKNSQVHSQGREVAGQFHYEKGRRALGENRVDDAIRAFATAVDYVPEKKEYRDALAQAQAMSGQSRDARSLYINQLADQLTVEQQRLWAEAQARIEEGRAHLERGDFTEAERSFQYAHTRLESLPFADERREPEQRKVEALLAETRQKRARQELETATLQNTNAKERQDEVRRGGLKIERDRIDAMIARGQKARERRDYDDAILLFEQVLKINRAEDRAHELLLKCRRERHVYLRQITADRWDEEHKLLSEFIRTSMLPQLELLVYSHDWPEIDARRSAPVRGLHEEQEEWRKKIVDQLDQEVTLDFQDHDLPDVVNFLQKITGVNFVLDPAVIAAGTPPVTLRVEAMKLRYVLDFIMKLTNLSYTVRNQAIFISNAAGVAGATYMKLYDIRDLLFGLTQFPGPELSLPEAQGAGGQGSRLLPPIADDKPPVLNEFIEIVKTVVAPQSWAMGGGTAEEYQGQMVVNQTADVHKQLAELLRSLRNQRGTQIHVKCKFLTVENTLIEQIGVDWNNFNNSPGVGFAPQIIPAGVNPAEVDTNGLGFSNFDDFYYGSAGALNNVMQNFQTAHSLNQAELAGTGLSLQLQTFHLNDGLFASALLQAVEQERRGNVVFEPDLTLFNGQRAHVAHVIQQAYISDAEAAGGGNGGFTPTISILSTGTVLDVTAVASADKKYITMTLLPTNTKIIEFRRFANEAQGAGGVGGFNAGGFNNGLAGNGQGGNGGLPGGVDPQEVGGALGGLIPLNLPTIAYNAVRTSATIPDGGTLLIGAMTDGESSRAHSGVPFLSHIPFLGRLFSKNGRTETELRTIIIIQADVILFDEIEAKL